MKRNSIKFTLFLSLSVFVILILVAVALSWHSLSRLQLNQQNVISHSIPALIDTADLIKHSGDFSTLSGRMLSASTTLELDTAWTQLNQTILQLTLTLQKNENFSYKSQNPISALLLQLKTNLTLIYKNIQQSLNIRRQIIEIKIRMEWAKNDVLDEIDPLLDDRQFYLQQLLNNTQTNSTDLVQLYINELTQLSNIRDQINLIADVVSRSIEQSDTAELDRGQKYSQQLIEQIHQQDKQLQSNPSLIALEQTINDLMQFITGENNLFKKQKQRQQLIDASIQLVKNNQQLLGRFNQQIKAYADVEQQQALTSSRLAFEQSQQAQRILLLVLIISALIAILVGWLYVDRFLVSRIIRLHHNMLSISQGKMDTRIQTAGNDEISDMASSLDHFRKTLINTQIELVQAGKLAALGQLSAGVAHELNQPLAAIRNYLHNSRLFLRRGKTDEAIETIEKIDHLAERMAEIIVLFKDFSRKPDTRISPIRLGEAIDNALTLLENPLHQQKIKINISSFDHRLMAMAELIRLEQVLVNIFSNAIDSMTDSQSRKLQIQIMTQLNPGYINILIGDSGRGIPEQDQDLIFEPFFTTKQTGQGLGLGLGISYNIIKDFDGKLSYRPSETGGSEFNIQLKAAN